MPSYSYEDMGTIVKRITMLRKTGGISTKEIASKLNLGMSFVQQVITSLLKNKVVERKRSHKGVNKRAQQYIEDNVDKLRDL